MCESSALVALNKLLLEHPNLAEFLNLGKIFSLPELPEEFLTKWMKEEHLSLVLRNQNITPEFLSRWSSWKKPGLKIQLIQNPRLSEEVKLLLAEEVMDWKLFVRHQSFTPELLRWLQGKVPPEDLLRAQQLSEPMLHELVKNAQPLEGEPTAEEAGRRKRELNSLLGLVFETQKLSEEFSFSLLELAQREKLEGVVPKCLGKQKFSSSTLQKLLQCETLALGGFWRELLQHQELTGDSLRFLVEKNWSALGEEERKSFLTLLARHQKPDQELTQWFSKEKELHHHFLTQLFLRGLEEGKDVPPPEDLLWEEVSNSLLSEKALLKLLELSGEKVNWYSLIKKNLFTSELVEALQQKGFLGFMEWWAVITFPNRLGSSSYSYYYRERKLWWKGVPENEKKLWFEKLLKGAVEVEKGDIKSSEACFLGDWCVRADWPVLLRTEMLPEWLLIILTHLSEKINRFWVLVSFNQRLSINFIKKHFDKFELGNLLMFQELPEEFLEDHFGFFEAEDWEKMLRYQKLSLEFRTRLSTLLQASDKTLA